MERQGPPILNLKAAAGLAFEALKSVAALPAVAEMDPKTPAGLLRWQVCYALALLNEALDAEGDERRVMDGGGLVAAAEAAVAALRGPVVAQEAARTRLLAALGEWAAAAEVQAAEQVPSGPTWEELYARGRADTVRAYLAELNPEAQMADGLDAALVGHVERFGQAPVALYDVKLCLAVFRQQGMSEEEAAEHFSFNVLGAWVGTPCFAVLFPREGE